MSDFGQLLRYIADFDLEAYLLDHGFEPSRAKGGEEWVGDCPKCGKPKCCVDIQKRGFHCWICQQFEDYWDEKDHCQKRRPAQGAGGVLALVKWLDGLDTKEAIEFVAHHGNVVDLTEIADLRAVEQILDATHSATIPYPDCAQEITYPLPYMERRGITMEDVRRLGIFWCPEGRYRNRIVFPVYDGERLIYWQARAMFEAEDCPPGFRFIKALNPERTLGCAVSSEVLMNLDAAARHPRVAVCEGPMDALRAGPDGVCTFGKAISPAQVRRLLLKGVKAIDFMWDGPKAKEPQGAWPEMTASAPWLSTFFDVRLVFLPHGDPGEWTREWLWHFRATAVPVEKLSKLSTL